MIRKPTPNEFKRMQITNTVPYHYTSTDTDIPNFRLLSLQPKIFPLFANTTDHLVKQVFPKQRRAPYRRGAVLDAGDYAARMTETKKPSGVLFAKYDFYADNEPSKQRCTQYVNSSRSVCLPAIRGLDWPSRIDRPHAD